MTTAMDRCLNQTKKCRWPGRSERVLESELSLDLAGTNRAERTDLVARGARNDLRADVTGWRVDGMIFRQRVGNGAEKRAPFDRPRATWHIRLLENHWRAPQARARPLPQTEGKEALRIVTSRSASINRSLAN
jgi:hypothetical protein